MCSRKAPHVDYYTYTVQHCVLTCIYGLVDAIESHIHVHEILLVVRHQVLIQWLNIFLAIMTVFTTSVFMSRANSSPVLFMTMTTILPG